MKQGTHPWKILLWMSYSDSMTFLFTTYSSEPSKSIIAFQLVLAAFIVSIAFTSATAFRFVFVFLVQI